MAKEGRSVYLEDLLSDPIARESEMILELGIKSIAGTPLIYEGRVIGVITVASTDNKVIHGDDRSLIAYMGNLITTAVVKAQLYEAEKQARLKLSALENISEAGLTTLGLDDLLNVIADRIVGATNMDWAGILLFENKNGRTVVEYTSHGCSVIRGKNLSKACSIMGEILEGGETTILKRNHLSQVKPHLSQAGLKLMAMVPVVLRQDWACMIGVGKKTGKTFTKKEIDLVESLSHRSALAIENALLFSKLEQTYLETVESLVKALEAKDKYTRGHSESVASLAREIAVAMDLDDDVVERVYVAGLLHDIGKIGIPGKILLKTTKLTTQDYDVIKLHPIKGYQILKPIRSLGDLAEIILQHHERFDGSGYPHGLSGEDIVIEARILAVADAYQAMVSDRPYRKRLPIDEAIMEIKKDAGNQFDPEIARVFLSILEKQAKKKRSGAVDKPNAERASKARTQG